jgi:hypothetical protein
MDNSVKVSPQGPSSYKPSSNTDSGLPHRLGRLDILETIHKEGSRLWYHISRTPEKKFQDYKVPPVIPMLKSMPSPVTKLSTRGVWDFPAAITCIESMFGTPLYKALLGARDIAGLPLMHGVGSFTKARGFVKGIDIGEACLIKDWVKGDTQIAGWLIKMCKRILERFIDFNLMNGQPCSPKMAEGNLRVWNFIWWYFQNTPIVFCDVLYRKTLGIPSGSLFTLLSWCVISLLISCFLAQRVEGRWLDRRDVRVCGDDSGQRVCTPGLRLEDYLKAAQEIGVEFHGNGKSSLVYWPNADSQFLLSTKFSDSAVLERDVVDVFARMCYPTRWVASREESIGRVLMVSMSVHNSMQSVYDFALHYATFKAAYLGMPIFVDRDILKYFRFVHGGRAPMKLGRVQKLGDLYVPFKDTVRMVTTQMAA